MLELIGATSALGFSAAASSSSLLTTVRVLRPEVSRSLPWWFAAGSVAGYTTGAIAVAQLLQAISFTSAAQTPTTRLRVVELVLGLAMLVCAGLLLHVRAAASDTILKLVHVYGRVRLKEAWTPRRLFFLGSRLVLRPRSLLITAAVGVVIEQNETSLLDVAASGLAFGATSVAAILILVLVFDRAPMVSRARLARASTWLARNATTIAAASATATGVVLVLRAAIF